VDARSAVILPRSAVLVADEHGVGVEMTGSANAEVSYEGKEVKATVT
jgi:hypothetical protein